MRNVETISLCGLIVLFLLLEACSEPRNFESEIRAMDSLNIVMDKTIQSLDSCTIEITDSITHQLTYIQSNYMGEIKESMARSLLRFGEFRNKTATLVAWKDSLHNRKDQLENEFQAFRNTLADRATHDGHHQEITELYADSVLTSLIDKQQQWHTKVNEWIQKQQETFATWQQANDTIQAWRDSIPQRKQP